MKKICRKLVLLLAISCCFICSVQAEGETLPSPPPVIQEEIGDKKIGSPIYVEATAYSIEGRTASGRWTIEDRTIAAGPDLEFGTVVYIPEFKTERNHGYFVVEDRGGAIGEGKIDIYMSSLSEARCFGRKNIQIYIFK